MKAARQALIRWIRERNGNFALSLALLAPLLLSAAGGALDLMSYSMHRSALQNAADAAALGTVREAALKGWDAETARAVARHIAIANYPDFQNGNGAHSIETAVDHDKQQATVTLTEDRQPYFLGFAFPSPQITVTATAHAAGATNVCVIGLDPSKEQTVALQDGALMTAPDCGVYSNSLSTQGLAAVDRSKLVSDLSCAAGGYTGSGSNFNKLPLTDCPAIQDPLASRPAPTLPANCTAKGLVIKGGGHSETLSPGMYCDGLTIAANADVTLEPGIYIIKGGPLDLASNASLYGRGVGFYFVGDNATFSLESGSSVDLEAATDGDLAGLLFYQAHGSKEATFLLRSNTASNMLGTVYLPNGDFVIDTNSKVADQSAYTVIVARSVTLMRKPNVVLNTNYGATSVPVPEGLGPTAQPQLLR